MAYCPFFSGYQFAEDMTFLGNFSYPSSFGPSLVMLKRFPPWLGPWAYYSKLAEAPRSFGPTIAPQNPAVRNLERGGGF